MNLISPLQAATIAETLSVKLAPYPNQVYDVYTANIKPLSYYQTNTRGVQIHPPAFLTDDLIAGNNKEALIQAILEINMLDHLVFTYTTQEKWINDPNIGIATLGLHLVWLYQDKYVDTHNFDIERLLRKSAGWLTQVWNVINGKPEPYGPRHWIDVNIDTTDTQQSKLFTNDIV